MFFSNKIISRQKSWELGATLKITEYYVIPAKQLIQFLQHPFEDIRKGLLVPIASVEEAKRRNELPNKILKEDFLCSLCGGYFI